MGTIDESPKNGILPPLVKGAVVGLVTEFDIMADVLVSLALIASVIIGETIAVDCVVL